MVRRRAGKNAIPAREANGVAIANNVKMVANPPTMPTHPENVGSTFCAYHRPIGRQHNPMKRLPTPWVPAIPAICGRGFTMISLSKMSDASRLAHP